MLLWFLTIIQHIKAQSQLKDYPEMGWNQSNAPSRPEADSRPFWQVYWLCYNETHLVNFLQMLMRQITARCWVWNWISFLFFILDVLCYIQGYVEKYYNDQTELNSSCDCHNILTIILKRYQSRNIKILCVVNGLKLTLTSGCCWMTRVLMSGYISSLGGVSKTLMSS